MYTLHTYCRACDFGKPSGPPGTKSAPTGERLIEVFNLGLQPLSNDFCKEDEEHSGFAPLKVMYCPRCSLAQLSVVVDPKILYSKYSYVTSNSATMHEHFKILWDCIRDRQPNAVNVLEIGSNDGRLLEFLKDYGVESVIGIDPAENLVHEAEKRGVRSICGLFDAKTTPIISMAMPRIDVIIARHVFCHVDDWHGFIKNLQDICDEDTLVVIEIPYVVDLLGNAQFDTIYHEHLSYLNIKAVEALLDKTLLRLDHIQHFKIHGGAIALYLRFRDYKTLRDDSVEFYLTHEKDNLTLKSWSVFEGKAKSNIAQLKNNVDTMTRSGKTVCGFGASAKSTVWVNACGFTRQQLKFICDSTPQKQWRFSPGSDIPITDEGALLRELPDYAVLFAWNYASEAVAKNHLWLEQGGKFIVPVPNIRIIGTNGATEE
jgi:SAM-dependent methyltransferase